MATEKTKKIPIRLSSVPIATIRDGKAFLDKAQIEKMREFKPDIIPLETTPLVLAEIEKIGHRLQIPQKTFEWLFTVQILCGFRDLERCHTEQTLIFQALTESEVRSLRVFGEIYQFGDNQWAVTSDQTIFKSFNDLSDSTLAKLIESKHGFVGNTLVDPGIASDPESARFERSIILQVIIEYKQKMIRFEYDDDYFIEMLDYFDVDDWSKLINTPPPKEVGWTYDLFIYNIWDLILFGGPQISYFARRTRVDKLDQWNSLRVSNNIASSKHEADPDFVAKFFMQSPHQIQEYIKSYFEVLAKTWNKPLKNDAKYQAQAYQNLFLYQAQLKTEMDIQTQIESMFTAYIQSEQVDD
jgi:hypothetical protein